MSWLFKLKTISKFKPSSSRIVCKKNFYMKITGEIPMQFEIQQPTRSITNTLIAKNATNVKSSKNNGPLVIRCRSSMALWKREQNRIDWIHLGYFLILYSDMNYRIFTSKFRHAIRSMLWEISSVLIEFWSDDLDGPIPFEFHHLKFYSKHLLPWNNPRQGHQRIYRMHEILKLC